MKIAFIHLSSARLWLECCRLWRSRQQSLLSRQMHRFVIRSLSRIDKQQQSMGIVVGVIDSTGRRTISYGKFDTGDNRAVDGNTIFEIGSVTKVFTSLLLADMVQRGEVALTDSVAKYLPAGVKMPERNGRQITLEDLATHTSGLPRFADEP